MRQFRLKYFLLSILTGILVALSFPKINAFYLIWIAFIPLIYSVLNNSVKNSLVYGFVSGFVCNLISLYWIFPFIQYNTNSITQSVIVSFLLWGYMALYFCLWAGFLSYTRRHLYPFLSIIFAACVWVALEFLRTYFLTGFPWNLLGYSQNKFLPMIQVADIFGVYGISFSIIAVNMLLYYRLYSKTNKNKYIITAVLTVILLLSYGILRMQKFNIAYGDKTTVAIVQPNIDQYKKWDIEYKNEILGVLANNIKYFESEKIDMIIYPETALPGFVQNDSEIQTLMKNISNTGVFCMIGAPSINNGKIYNSIYAVNGNGYLNIHDKNHLVIFGEYIPFRKILSKFFGILNSLGDFSKGTEMNVYNNGKITVGPMICSENFFPSFSRRLSCKGARILTNHTNDAWFFDTFAPYQHFVMNIFRAVENRKSVIVSANSGLSGIIDASGRTILETKINQNVNLIGNAYQNDYITVYSKTGDILPVICILFTLFIAAVIFII